MINKIKSWWFRVPQRKREANSVYEAMGLTHTRTDELAEAVSFIFGNVARVGDVIQRASKLCRSNKELLAVGMMIQCVISDMRKPKPTERENFIKNNQRSVRVHELVNSDALHESLGISLERGKEIQDMVVMMIEKRAGSVTGIIEKISVSLTHPNELVFAVSLVNALNEVKIRVHG